MLQISGCFKSKNESIMRFLLLWTHYYYFSSSSAFNHTHHHHPQKNRHPFQEKYPKSFLFGSTKMLMSATTQKLLHTMRVLRNGACVSWEKWERNNTTWFFFSFSFATLKSVYLPVSTVLAVAFFLKPWRSFQHRISVSSWYHDFPMISSEAHFRSLWIFSYFSLYAITHLDFLCSWNKILHHSCLCLHLLQQPQTSSACLSREKLVHNADENYACKKSEKATAFCWFFCFHLVEAVQLEALLLRI